MNGDRAAELPVALDFLGSGQWTLRSFADTPESADEAERIEESTKSVSADETIKIRLAPAGGFAAQLSPVR